MFTLNQKFNAVNSLFALGITTLGFFMVPLSAQAFTLVDRTDFDDTAFELQRTNGDFTEVFVAEGRIGNNNARKGYEERELGLNTATGTNVKAGDLVWEMEVIM
jgi:hypothetical protein